VFHAIEKLENLKKLRTDPLKIKKVIAIEGIEDFVYIEADKEQDVQNVSNRYHLLKLFPSIILTFIFFM
jgi:hypothetical protein